MTGIKDIINSFPKKASKIFIFILEAIIYIICIIFYRIWVSRYVQKKVAIQSSIFLKKTSKPMLFLDHKLDEK